MLAIHGFDLMRKCVRSETIIEGYITNGGVATNVIPEYASGIYTFRSNDSKYVEDTLVPWMKDVIEGSAKATRTKFNITRHGYPLWT